MSYRIPPSMDDADTDLPLEVPRRPTKPPPNGPAFKKAPARLSCTGKEKFQTPQLAAKVARKWAQSKRRRGKDLTRPVSHYACPHCRAWHIGGMGK